MKEWRPQVLAGIIILGLLAGMVAWMGFPELAGVAIGGIVAAVTTLSKNGS